MKMTNVDRKRIQDIYSQIYKLEAEINKILDKYRNIQTESDYDYGTLG